ncbi:PQQ-dependent dehydrogenase, methanol/ethanol family [Novosphingobium sp.]|uniref:PQQ-dependent dehydrogenase, methanol/ethanol family n=1 Tax=Novosphingobium sp. TaxID=1874826 RepID=UPI0025EA1908|nr:PQQ-dependent dehydrogenase, methanol/ethanol family [Novosphingobium sp.]
MRLKVMALAILLPLAACKQQPSSELPGAVNAERILAANPDEWLSYGRTYDEQRHSPLDQINKETVKDLGLAWFADLDTARGQEATPLAIDGKIYITTAWSKAKAYDALTGKLEWEYDPKVPGERGVAACCDVVNRGMAAWGDKLFMGTLDGRLVALDRKTGKEVWSVVTLDQSKPYTITGAPRVINGMVLIGNGGAEMGVRGFLTAYDADSGKQLWRFYSVPDEPGKNTDEHLIKAESTWKGEWWKLGGGGTMWDAMAYDPELDLLYVGVGNGSPWNQHFRSQGEGDNLYLSSIVALRPKTGEYVWHFQTTPGETWDYTATQHIMLADLTIGGAKRKVLMQAPKNGFFFVLDRTDGKLISANNYVPVNWATGFDLKTGRPIENPDARYYRTGKLWLGSPGPIGAHNWHPMAFDPKEGLVYIPAINSAFPFIHKPDWKPNKHGFNVGLDLASGAMPADAKTRADAIAATTGELIAWDPVAQKARWTIKYPASWNGGLLATAGGLLFQGNAGGEFAAMDSATGKKLWSFQAQTGVVAPASTFRVKGEQYVAVLAGWGGAWPLAGGLVAEPVGPVRNHSRLLVFKLGGTAKLPDPGPHNVPPLDPPTLTGTPEQVADGARNFGQFCGVCHGDAAIGTGVTRDLRRAGSLGDAKMWNQIVIGGALAQNGMISWKEELNDQQAENLRQYVIKRAHEDKALGMK